MKLAFIAILCCCTTLLYAQHSIEGFTTDALEKTILPYVNIGIANTNIGTISNSDGRFTLKLPDNQDKNAMVTFSYIGYATQKYPVSFLLNKQNAIILQPSAESLEEVVINLKKPKARKLGRTSKGLGLMHINFYTSREAGVDDRLSKEMGMKFNINRDCKVNDLNFNITSNEFESVKFRINFYSVKDGMPDKLLIDENIICEIKNTYLGWFTADLKPYNIYLTKETGEVAVTIQWLESKKSNTDSKFFALSVAKAPFSTYYYREKAMDKWTSGSNSLSFYLDILSE